jgi:hypothetical protein
VFKYLEAFEPPKGSVCPAVIVALTFAQFAVEKVFESNIKFHGQTSTNPALFIRVPLLARVKDKSPLPSVGTAEYTTSSLYPEGIKTREALFNKSLIL